MACRPAEVGRVGVEARGRRRGGRKGTGAPDPQRRHHRPRDLLLHREDLAGEPLVGLRPQVEALAHVHQVHGDAEAVAGLAHAALEHRGDVEPAAGLAGVLAPAPDRERGGRRGDPEAGHPAERGGQLLRHTVAEVLVGGVGTRVDQREHRDGAGPRLGHDGGGRGPRRGVAEPEGDAEEGQDGEGEEGPTGRDAQERDPLGGLERGGRRRRGRIGRVSHA